MRAPSGARARRRHLGISRPQAHPYPFGGDVLGRLSAAAGDRRPPRPRRIARDYWNAIAERMRRGLLERAWNREAQGLYRGLRHRRYGRQRAAAGRTRVCRRPTTRALFPPSPPSSRNWCARRHVMRYAAADDFGLPETEFLICRFWLIDALWALGRREEARDLFVDALQLAQPLWPAVGRHPSARPARCGAISRRPIRWPD